MMTIESQFAAVRRCMRDIVRTTSPLPSPEDGLVAAEVLYADTGNPLFAWWALLAARERRQDIPTWALEYLERAAALLLSRAYSPAPSVALEVASALRFKVPGKRGAANPFRAFRGDHGLGIVVRLRRALDHEGSFAAAAAAVAVDIDASGGDEPSQSSLRRLWRRWGQ